MRIRLTIAFILTLACVSVSQGQGFPVGWTQLSGTALNSFVPANNFCGDGYPFASRAASEYNQWSGGTADTNGNNLLIWGGGHDQGYDNSVYQLHLNTNGTGTMSRRTGPTCPTNFPTSGTAACSLAGGTVPNAMQTYDGLSFVASRNSMIWSGQGVPANNGGNFQCPNIWEYNLTANSWTQRASWTDSGAAGMISSSYDPVSGKVFIFNQYMGVVYNPTTFAVQQFTSSFASDSHGVGEVDAVNGNYVYLDNGAIQYFPLASAVAGNATIINGGSCGTNDAYVGLTWNPDIGKLVAYPWSGNSIYTLTFSGGTYSCATTTFSGGPGAPDASYQGTFGRFQYFKNLLIYVVCNSTSSNCFALNTGTTPNPFSTRSVGVNVPGGAASIVSNQPFNTGALPTCTPVSSCFAQGPLNVHYAWASPTTPSIDSTIFPPNDGPSSVKFTVAPTMFQAQPGFLDYNFKSDFTGLFGAGQEFYVQYKQRIGAAMFNAGAITNNDGIKLDITTEGDNCIGASSPCYADDCGNTPAEIVTQTDPTSIFNGPWMYVNCAYGGGGPHFMSAIYEPVQLNGIAGSNLLDQPASGCPHYNTGIPITDPTCWIFIGDEWFTVQKHIKIGAFGSTNSVIEQWFAHANSPSVLTTNASDAAIPFAGTPTASGKYGKISIGVYGTGVTYNVNSQVNFDSIIISKRRIPDPDVATPNAPDSLSLSVATGSVTASWRVNSQNGTGQDDTGFLVERCTGTTQTCFPNPQSGFSQIGTTVAGATSYQDGTVVNGTTYTYRVRAKNGAGNSAYTTSICFNGGATCGGTAVAQGSGGNPAVGLSPTSLSFGNQSVQITSSQQNVTLTNTGSSTLTITNITLTGTNPSNYAMASNTCGASLGVGANCIVGITFTPTATGSRTANLTFTTNSTSSPDNVPLTGTGQAPIASFSPIGFSFGGIKIGLSSSVQAVTLTNTGSSIMSIASITLTGANTTDFSISTTCGPTLAASASCLINVTFTPILQGLRSASISVTSNTLTSPDADPFSGTGFLPVSGTGTISGAGTIKVQP